MVINIIISEKVTVHWAPVNKEYFISKGYVFTKYGKEFTVDVNDLYDDANVKVMIKCDICGKEYQLPYNRYIKNINNFGKTVCFECSRSIISKNRWGQSEKNRQLLAFNLANDICNDCGYQLLTTLDNIKNRRSRIKYICPIHGVHEVTINNLASGKRCPGCAKDNTKNVLKLSAEEVSKRISECGGTILNPQEYINNSERNLKITCPRCGNPFVTSLVLFTQHGGQLCPDCYRKESVGERRVREYLENNNIEYEFQKWFIDCRDIKPLPFDFYLPQKNIIIEFDGIQHIKDGGNFFHSSYDLNTTKKHDIIKNEYCNEHNIELIRIPYTQIDHISEILDNKLINSHEDIV